MANREGFTHSAKLNKETTMSQLNPKKESEMQTPYQHGENVLVPIAKLPEGKIQEHKMVIVGHSETGHHHVLTSDQPMRIVEIDDRMYIETMFDALLTHKKAQDKHDTLTVKPGIWEVKHKTEYNPITQVLSRVFD